MELWESTRLSLVQGVLVCDDRMCEAPASATSVWLLRRERIDNDADDDGLATWVGAYCCPRAGEPAIHSLGVGETQTWIGKSDVMPFFARADAVSGLILKSETRLVSLFPLPAMSGAEEPFFTAFALPPGDADLPLFFALASSAPPNAFFLLRDDLFSSLAPDAAPSSPAPPALDFASSASSSCTGDPWPNRDLFDTFPPFSSSDSSSFFFFFFFDPSLSSFFSLPPPLSRRVTEDFAEGPAGIPTPTDSTHQYALPFNDGHCFTPLMQPFPFEPAALATSPTAPQPQASRRTWKASVPMLSLALCTLVRRGSGEV